ncbi:MAG: hypothetical protein Q7T42_00015 [Methylotenera sp.]|uniref:hypothetical protein n=1 Tax=Methylotenera sp. TaxID=2051956 RepID=UPI00272206A5|nr:hypothetical protein [Methylotenera sp.]MDO9392348.1 hypothetical protein [Methylotenera sp.]
MSKQTFITSRDNRLNIWRSATQLTLSANFLFQSNLILASTVDGRWHAGIGDPTLFGLDNGAFLFDSSCAVRV